MEEALAKAKILMEALPWIREHSGKTVVIKYGGQAMVKEAFQKAILSDVVLMKYVGLNPVIIHGGGPEINHYLKKMGKEPRFVKGLRVTDQETLDLVKMVLVGKVNKKLVSLINREEKLAVGLSGDDGRLIQARKLVLEGEDLGFVGEVEKVNTQILENLIKEGFIPAVASIGAGKSGQSYNINADFVAGEVAAALKADKIIFLTNVSGLYRNFEDKDSLISELVLKEAEELVREEEVGEGMLPKIKGAVIALKGGVSRAHILDGTLPHALLLEIFTDKGIGTMLTP